ncbi:MAG TPA: isochorismatase family cysteine hydrolase [Alphaproteobacteria bacterium]|jgi:ureidoacrylate peracid hydrolase|nr:isochorismatase family cysteine hydrolase [Alphaproteobacteria bacterium]
MHDVDVRPHIKDRVLARRGRYHLYDRIDPRRSAFVVIDMINMFMEPGAPAEVPASRGIVDSINRLAAALRPIGCRVVWVNSPIVNSGGKSEWDKFYNTFVAEAVRQRTIEASAPGSHGQALWPALKVAPEDIHVPKNRYSALIGGSSQLERMLRSFDIQWVLIGGTKTNVCCESTARDAMMLDFDVVMVRDCCAALSDDEHRATLENVIQQFGDVMTGDEVLATMRRA